MNTVSTQSYEDGADLLVAALYHFTNLTNLDEKQIDLGVRASNKCISCEARTIK